MKPPANRNWAATALTACILGLAICPYFYIGFGGFKEFSLPFVFVVLPPFVVGTGFLLWRYLRRPTASSGSVPLFVGELLSWGAVVGFLFLMSGIALMTSREAIGLASIFFLLASLVCLPVVTWRDSALEARIDCIPKAISAAVFVLVLVAAGWSAMAYFLTPPRFV